MARPRTILCAVAALSALACRSSEQHGGSTGSATSAGPASSAPRVGGVAILVAGPRPAIRDATAAGPAKDGVTAVARAMLSRVTPADGARVALRFDVTYDGGGATPVWPFSSARVRITKPDGSTRALDLAPLPREVPVPVYAGRVAELVIDGSAIRIFGEPHPWKAPEPDLLAAPGKYHVRLEGRVEVGASPIAFATGDVPFEVTPAGPAFRPIAEIDAVAASAVSSRRGGTVAADSARGAIDDVADQRWIRFWLDSKGYEVAIVDVLVSPAGAVVAMQEFEHFTCVARGTPIATPGGDVAVESLAPGDLVFGYDVEARRKVPTVVVATAESVREALIDLGSLRVTPEHPVLADGRWVPAGDVAKGAALVPFAEGAPAFARPSPAPGRAAVFDVTVAWPHTFFAGGVVVHNKARQNEMAPTNPWRGTFLRATDAPAGPPGR